MKRIVTLSLVGALTLGMLVTGVAGAHQGGGRGQAQAGKIGNPAGLKAWTPCVLAPTVSGTSVFAHATAAKPGGSINVEVRVKHPDAAVTTYGATVTPTFPAALVGSPVNLTRNGTSFVLTGSLPVPSTATAGSATLAVAGTYGSSSFTCAGLKAKIAVPKASKPPVCVSTPAGLQVQAWATPAMPGGALWVVVMVKKQDPSATLAATATATIPPAGATAPRTLSRLGRWDVLAGSFPVGTDATPGATATVLISGTYTVASVSTSFTCSLSTQIKNVKSWP
jgi:hypothetical protein